MPEPLVVFDRVWKAFNRGERHDSLRDLIPAAVSRVIGRKPAARRDVFWALRDVSFEVHAGEALGIIGRNGAGKSTILKVLTRILKPTRGYRCVRGRTGALIEVAAGFHPDLTGRENVYLQGAIMGMKRAEIARHFDEIVSFAGLEAFIDTPVKRYSSGMNARLGFSIAAHLDPEVLLIDEVLAVGDMAFQAKCQARMKEFRRRGVAIVFISHYLPAVTQLCSQALLIDQGEVVRAGSPADVITAYSRGGSSCDSESVSISAALHRPGAAAGVFEVKPGQRLVLDVRLEFHVAAQSTSVGVVVWDLAKDLYAYGAPSDALGIPLIDAVPGDVRTFTFGFDANLTKGLYAVEINVVDHSRHRFLAAARGIHHFQVVENVSYDGVANLYLTGSEHMDAAHASGHRPALAAVKGR